MNPFRWLASLLTRRSAPGAEHPASWQRSSPPSEIDIVLSEIAPDALDGHAAEETDYDVRSLGAPIDPVALHGRTRDDGRPR